MKNKRKPRWTRGRLLALGIPSVLIPGILLSIALGWNPAILNKNSDYHAIKTIFPEDGVARYVTDGDTFELQNGVVVRLIGIDAPNRGDKGEKEAQQQLSSFIRKKQVYLEYDRYQNDQYGRVLAWIWVGCEEKPVFTPPDYMRLTLTSSRLGLTENPEGCQKGVLVNEKMVDGGWASVQAFKDRGALKYEERILRGR